MVFERWAAAGCEDHADTLKMVGLIDFFLPFFPLERAHVRAAFNLRLKQRAAALWDAEGVELKWSDAVIAFLTERVRVLHRSVVVCQSIRSSIQFYVWEGHRLCR